MAALSVRVKNCQPRCPSVRPCRAPLCNEKELTVDTRDNLDGARGICVKGKKKPVSKSYMLSGLFMSPSQNDRSLAMENRLVVGGLGSREGREVGVTINE